MTVDPDSIRSRGRPRGPAKPFVPIPLRGLRALRIEASLTLENVGALLDVNRAHYRKFETGAVRLDINRAKILADYFGVPIEGLL
ncbi:helix-turn-helix transcriptional regulator [Sphingosinicella sp. BN140058]|uniref:helix-turn-helix transcriptional regulator n=1 Tax=Sphingosinicella sp. BN140058 TaxID=1892855 RepID=UPI001FB17B5C|nr:helix-turn-helix transcriptional regulator [Sphingosinicella sp. BN140058]